MQSVFTSRKPRLLMAHSGLSLVEMLVGLGLLAFMSVLAVPLFLVSPQDSWARVTDDYIRHLSATYNKIQLQHGNTPLKAQNPDPPYNYLYLNGVASGLQIWESATKFVAKTGSTPAQLQYPSELVVYVDPQDPNITDPNSELPRHQTSAINQPDNPVTASSPQTIMTGTDDREWLLLDINGSKGSNQLSGANSDRVLLYVEDSTGRILTAWQKCWMMKHPAPDVAHNNIPYGTGTACTLSTVFPTRTYYKSFYDTYKNYVGTYNDSDP